MVAFFQTLPPVTQALLSSLFTWAVTIAGAAMVFFFKSVQGKMIKGMLGFAAGVMMAASFFSLLSPAIEMAKQLQMNHWFVVAVGFLGGGLFLFGVDKTLPHLHMGFERNNAEGLKTRWQRSLLLIMAITLHNIPEGLAVGVAFGAATFGLGTASLSGAIVLAIGIGLQNFPEGAAVSLPLRMEGYSKFRAFLYGQASGIVEPIAAVIGASAVIAMQSILPYVLAFAAGAMIYVVVEDLIPQAQQKEDSASTDIATIGCMAGFALMMVLDIALG